jgi:hypothetical protein
MSNVVEALPIVRRVHLKEIQVALCLAVEEAATAVGLEGVKAFFDGYKDSVDAEKLAA